MEGGGGQWREEVCNGGRRCAMEGGGVQWREEVCNGGKRCTMEGGVCNGGRR